MNLSGNTILITGGATGIGLALAEAFLKLGNVVIAVGRSKQNLKQAVAKFPGLIPLRCDVTDREARTAMIAWITQNYPACNVLVNNAGIQRAPNFAHGEINGAAIAAEIGTNLLAPILLGAEMKPLLETKPSAIINITSGLAFCPLALVPVYCATKAALHSFTISLRHQLRATSIEVIEIAPPIVDTQLGKEHRVVRQGSVLMTPSQFAAEAMEGLAAGRPEILVDGAEHMRQSGDSMFSSMNP